MPLETLTLDQLTIDDEASFGHVALYHRLKGALRSSGHRFLVPADGTYLSRDRALFLNHTYWGGDGGADVLCEAAITADEVTHMALHHLVDARLTGASGAPSASAFLFAESIASAFDLYLVGRLLENRPDSEFIESQVPIMREAAEEAGMLAEDFADLLTSVALEPERAFEDLRVLLLEATTALVACAGAEEAERAFERFSGHRFEPLLHHYQLSNWILYSRAYATANAAQDATIQAADQALRAAPDSLAWLEEHWLPLR